MSILSAPEGHLVDTSRLLAQLGASSNWQLQPQSLGTYQLNCSLSLRSEQVPNLVSELARYGLIADVEVAGRQLSERFLLHPALGIHRQQLDEAGEVLLRSGTIELFLQQSAGSQSEFQRALRRADGTLWLDLMAPNRRENRKITMLHRVG